MDGNTENSQPEGLFIFLTPVGFLSTALVSHVLYQVVGG